MIGELCNYRLFLFLYFRGIRFRYLLYFEISVKLFPNVSILFCEVDLEECSEQLFNRIPSVPFHQRITRRGEVMHTKTV